MTPRQFFNIVLKIFGLFFLREILNSIPQLISAILMLFRPEDFTEGLFILAFYIALTYQLIFKTPFLVDKLKLDKDFNDQIFDFKIPLQEVLTISIIVIAGVILVNQIPYLVKEIFEIVQTRKLSFGSTKTDYSYIIISTVKIVIAALLIGERQRIVEFITSRNSKSESSELTEKID